MGESGGTPCATAAGGLTGLRERGCAGFGGVCVVVQNRSIIRKRLACDSVSWESDDEVAPVFANADAGGVDEICVAGVTAFDFHLSTFLGR